MLTIAATPIGNLGDATRRLVDALEAAAVVAAEDTRVASRLLAGLSIANRPRLVSVNEHSERGRLPELVALARDGDLLLVSDAGMPTVSDPGYLLVRAAVEAGVDVTVLPGASAVLTALAVSGLPTDRFAFEGFPPRRQGERVRRFEEVAADRRTLVWFESPNRLRETLESMRDVLGADRPAVVCRELTKLYEEVVRGTLAELARWAAGTVRGEIVLVVAGAPEASAMTVEDAVPHVLARVAAGERLKDAVAAVAADGGVLKRELYDAAVAARG